MRNTTVEQRQSIVFALSMYIVVIGGFGNGRRRSAISCCQYLDRDEIQVATKMPCNHSVTQHDVVASRT